MEESDDDALIKLFKSVGLNHSKWLTHFHHANIKHPNELLDDEREKLYRIVIVDANPEEEEPLRNLFGIPGSSTFEKVYLALEASGLDPVYWSRVLSLQAGVITEQALKYIEEEFYPHLVQFARIPAEKRALRKLLNIDAMDDSFSARYEKQQKSFENRKEEIAQCLNKLKEYQTESKPFDLPEVQGVKQRALECLQIPSEFWFHESTYESFIERMEVFNDKMTAVLDKRDVLDDSAVIQTASSGLVLKGIFIQCEKTKQCLKSLVQPPKDIPLHHTFYSQHVKQVYMSEISLEEEIFSEGGMHKETPEYSTFKCFVVPVASCVFKPSQLRLTDEAVQKIKWLEELLNSNFPLFTQECKNFFTEFGSHACLGPFHFGGYYHWCCSTPDVLPGDIPTVQSLHNEVIQLLGTTHISSIGDQNIKSLPGLSENNHSLESTSIKVTMIGGSQPSSVAIWRNCLLVENSSWVLLDSGTEYIPVWELAAKSHAHDLRDISFLTTCMQNVWDNTDPTIYKNSGKRNALLEELLQVATQWIEANDHLKHCEEFLHIMLRTKQEVVNEEIDLSTWPSYFLSEHLVKKCLSINLDILKTGNETRVIKSLLHQVVGPIDLEGIEYFAQKEQYLKLVFETEEPYGRIGHQDIIEIAKICRLVSDTLPSSKASNEVDFQTVSYPRKSLRATTLMTKALTYVRGHLHKTSQFYDDILLLTLLLPFNYMHSINNFLSAITKSDMKCLADEIEDNSRAFFSIKVQEDGKKLQAHLILLTIDVFRKWDVTTSNVQSHFQYMEENIPHNHLDKDMTEILNSLMKNTRTMDWAYTRLQYIMKGISVDQNDTLLVKLLDVNTKESDTESDTEDEAVLLSTNDEYSKLFLMLELSEYFPQKLTLEEALQIRTETLRYVNLNDSKNQNECSSPSLYPFMILQKIMSFDSRCRMMLSITASSDKETALQSVESNSSGLDTEDEGDSEENSCIHPMDGLLAVIHCADNFLRQDLVSRLATCQIAIPFVLPNPLTKEVTFTLWPMRTIIKQWKSDHGHVSHEIPIVSYRSPIISFVRFGTHQRSKSRLINVIMNNSGYDTFFHYDCDGGSEKQILVPGLIDVSWYFPSATDNTFEDAVTFVNLHGDARKFSKQMLFLSEISFMTFVLLNEGDWDEIGMKTLVELCKLPGGIVLLRTNSVSGKTWSEKYKQLKQMLPQNNCTAIKLSQKNEAKVKESIRGEIRSGIEKQWKKDCKCHPSIEDCREIATRCGITTDEDKSECRKGRQLAFKIKDVITKFTSSNSSESPKKMLRLQSDELWHEWAAKDKELYRHKKGGMLSIEEYTMQLREDMGLIRKIQLGHAQEPSSLMETFLTSLLSFDGNIRRYFLQWLKIILDDLSREILPPLHKKYHTKKKYLVELQQAKAKDIAAIEKCKLEMERINKNLIYASFGLEHLFREIGQLYEAMSFEANAPEHIHLCKVTQRLPKVAAELLIEGFPLELMDGDAAHVPVTWVSAVLEQVQQILHDPSIITLSILGLQSTGKSTLLNTLFGVRFSVSAGRCTRGAFMQLVPLHAELRKECNCNYFLLVDTEGLRAPELDAMQTQNHDNELATFVIGLANLTIINIYGETPGDLDDILQTSVHAFLRMKAVKLTPGCHFVHQNVSAVMAGEKGMMGRFNFKAKLDTMTEAAAKEENLDTEYCTFNEVIRFNDETDVSHFPSLWVGDPPMAPVNPGYSHKAIALKSRLVSFAREMNRSHMIAHLSNFRDMLVKFWKAVLYENFVFSFKNTLESSTYSFLDSEYGKWSWSFQQEMLTWEHILETKVANAADERDPRKVFEDAKNALLNKSDEKYQALKTEMATFFEERPEREILVKWKNETETQFRHTREQLMRHAKNHCEQVWNTHLAEAKLKDIKKNHREVIVDQVKTLIPQLEEKLPERELEVRFEKQWKEWIKELAKMSIQTHTDEKDIKSEVQASLREHFKANDSMLIQKQDPLSGKPLEQWGETLTLELQQKQHVTLRQRSWLFIKREVEWRTLAEAERDQMFLEVEKYLQSIQDKDFHPSFTNKVLHKIKSMIDEVSCKDFQFTATFRIDMALTACGYALTKFRAMVKQFKEKHDQVRCFEKDMKQKYLQLFKDLYNQTTQELAAARFCCNDLQLQIRKEVFQRLSLEVVKNLRDRSNSYYIGEKRVVIRKILRHIGQELRDGEFNECSKYIRHPAESIRKWVEIFTKEYCDHGEQVTRLAVHADIILNDLMITVINAAKRTTKNFHTNTLQIRVWIEAFATQLSSELKLDKCEMCEQGEVQDLKDIENFTEELVKRLNEVKHTLKIEFRTLRSSALQECEVKPYDVIHDGVDGASGVAGCTAMCPFCHEPCSLNQGHGGIHKVDRDQHRPQCLGGWRYESSNKMVLKNCAQSVDDNDSFYKEGTSILHPYRRCSEIYPKWEIMQQSPGESSNYWKYVVAKFRKQLASFYSMKEDLDINWDRLEWSHAIVELK